MGKIGSGQRDRPRSLGLKLKTFLNKTSASGEMDSLEADVFLGYTLILKIVSPTQIYTTRIIPAQFPATVPESLRAPQSLP